MNIEEYRIERDKKIIKLYREHSSVEEIMKEMNVDYVIVNKVLGLPKKELKIKQVYSAQKNRLDSWG